MRVRKCIKIKFLLVLFLCFNSMLSNAQTKHKQLIDSADVASEKMNFQSALFFWEDALEISKKAKDTVQLIGDLIGIGETHKSLDNKTKSIENFMRALRFSESIKNDSLKFEVSIKIVDYFMDSEQLEKAEKHLNRAKAIAGTLGNKDFYRSYYNTLGILERRKNNFKASIQAYKKGLELTSSNMPDEKFNSFINLSTAYSYSGDFQQSLSYLLRAEKLNESLQDDWYEIVLCGQLGRTFLLLGNAEKAIQYYVSGLEKSEEVKNHDMIERFNRELARANYKLGNYQKAYDFYAQFVIELQNSHDRENASAIAEMSAKYEHEKNEQRINSLEKEKVLKAQIYKSQIDRRNLWIWVSLLILFITIVIALIVVKNQRNKQRLKLELIEKQEELARQQAELKGQEVERNRLSRELHDGLGGTLASIKMRLSSKNIAELSPILNDIDDACQDVRNMSHSLNSSFMNEATFYEQLAKLAVDLQNRSTLVVNLEFMPMEELNSLESETRHQCYRIIQELSNNVLKHANATVLTIGLMLNEDEVILLIEDDGIGFDTHSSSTGIGLNNVRQRLKTINGAVEITSNLNVGTAFSINFPYKSRYEN